MDTANATTAPEASDKFQKKRELILDAASQQIAQRGLKGLTFVGVAESVGLNTTSITYYFKRKELLAAATLERGITQWAAMINAAGQAKTPRARVRALIHAFLDLMLKARTGEAAQLTILSDMRALDDPIRSELVRMYQDMLWTIAGYFGPLNTTQIKARNLARAQILIDCLHWSRVWLPIYSAADFPRVEARLFDLLEYGFAVKGATWAPELLKIDEEPQENGPDISRETYLRAATLLINERGYRGASVERIAAHLNVSKGSFYHHLSGKDDLVLDCFDRSYSRVSKAQHMAIAQPGTYWHRLISTISSLLTLQFDGQFPLLRTTALQVLPQELRPSIIQRSDRMAQRFAGIMIDGIADGSIRAIDPMIASQCLMAALNAGFDFRVWAAARPSLEEAVRIYTEPLAFGMFDD